MLVFICSVSFLFAQQNVKPDLIVKVNKSIITQQDLDKRYSEITKLGSPDGKTYTKKEILELIINDELLKNEIREMKNLVLKEKELQDTIDQYKKMAYQLMLEKNPKAQFTDAAFKEYLEKDVNVTYETFVQKVKDQVLGKQYLLTRAEKKLAAIREKKYNSNSDFPVEIPNQRGGSDKYFSIKEFYERNEQQFYRPKFVELKHIFVATVKIEGEKYVELPAELKALSKKKIDEAYSKLLKGENFNDVCFMTSEEEDVKTREYTNPKTGDKERGYLGPVYMSGEYAEVGKERYGEKLFYQLFELELGKISPVLEGKLGYHIFFVMDKKPGQISPFDEVKDSIIDIFRMVQQNKAVTDEYALIIKELRSKAEIKYFKDEYKN